MMSRTRRISFSVAALLLSFLLLAPALSEAQGARPHVTQIGPCQALGTICVGADTACQYANLQDAIDAASTAGGDSTTIHVAGNQDYSGQHLVISNRNLSLVGGYSSCADYVPSGYTTLDGSLDHSVITIGETYGHRSVSLKHLFISGGGGRDLTGFHLSSAGGGVYIDGNVAVAIESSDVKGNTATFGGGIYIDGQDGAVLDLVSNTYIEFNAASNNGPNGGGNLSGKGGGLFCANGGTIGIAQSQVSSNSAVKDSNGVAQGGGVYLDGCELTAGDSTENYILGNNASDDGGGIFATNNASVLLHGSAGIPFFLWGNNAGHHGGGMYLNGSSASLDGVAVHGNRAGGLVHDGVGGGIYAFGSTVAMVSNSCRGCSSIQENAIEGLGFGTAIYATTDSGSPFATISLSDTRIHNNRNADTADTIFISAPSNSNAAYLYLGGDVVSANQGPHLIKIVGGVEAFVTSSTIAQNNVGGVFMNDYQTRPIHLSNSIIREAATTSVISNLDDTLQECLMLHSGSGIPLGPTVVEQDPHFVNPDGYDYHLQAFSRAIDFCAPTVYHPDTDYDGQPRGIDAPQVPSFLAGAYYDLGAYEWSNERIFANGFESGVLARRVPAEGRPAYATRRQGIETHQGWDGKTSQLPLRDDYVPVRAGNDSDKSDGQYKLDLPGPRRIAEHAGGGA